MNSIVSFAVSNGGYDTPLPIPQKYANTFGLSSINPSIFYFNGKFYFNSRIVNYYKIFSNENFNFLDYNQIIFKSNETENEYSSVNVITELGSGKEVDIIIPFYFKTIFNGLEDAKFVIWDGILYMYGTRLDVVKDNGIIVIYELSSTFEIVRCINTKPIEEKRIEKNWMAIPDKPFQFIYDVNRSTIVKVDKDTGKLEIIKQNDELSLCDEELRGCASLCRVNEDRYLAIVHSSYIGDELKYRFRLVYYDNDFNISNISDWFVFKNEMCEFCCGMFVNDDILNIGYSVLDSSSYVLTIPIQKLNEFWHCNQYNNMFDSDYFYSLALSNERNFITNIPIFNYVACNTNPFNSKHYECAIRVISYWISNTQFLIDNCEYIKDMCIKYNTIYPQNCETYYLLSLIYRFEDNLEMAFYMKKEGDKLKNNMKLYFEKYINVTYL